MHFALILVLSLAACSEKEPEDTGHATDGGATDGGSTDGGSTDGGSTDGGATDGGATDGGATDGGATGTDLAGIFTASGGCSDTFIWAANDDQTWALWFSDDSGIVARAYAAGETVTDSYDMAMDYSHSPTVAVQHGSNLRDAFCNDVPGGHTVDQQWYQTAGMVTISVTPTGKKKKWGEMPAEATLTLEGAVFTAHGEEPVEVSTFETTVAVGWLPG